MAWGTIAFALLTLGNIGLAQNDLTQFLGQIPQCGVTCIFQELPKSTCSLANSTCICTDAAFNMATQECVLNTCVSPLDAIETARIESVACARPTRDRRGDLNLPLTLLILGFFAVLTRLYARWSAFETFQSDDWMMLVCVVIYAPFTVIGQYGKIFPAFLCVTYQLTTAGGRLAFARDIWTIDIGDITTGLMLFYAAQPMYLVCLGLTKVSLLCFLLRIFPNLKFRWITYAVILVTALSTTIFVFLGIFQCFPVAFNWEGWKGDFGPGRCVNINALVVSAACFSIALDLVILLLPLPLLLGLHMSRRSKASILLMFGLGVFIIITATLRLSYIIKYRRSANPTWDNTDVLIWSGIEVSVSMLVTSLPAIRTLLSKSIPQGWSAFLSRTGLSREARSEKQSGTHGTSYGDTKGSNRGAAAVGGAQDLELPSRPQAPEPIRRVLASKFSSYKRPHNESEEALELGDRVHGNVYTEIVADDNTGHQDPFCGWQDSMESGIRVHTTTRVASMVGDRGQRPHMPAASRGREYDSVT